MDRQIIKDDIMKYVDMSYASTTNKEYVEINKILKSLKKLLFIYNESQQIYRRSKGD